MDAERLLSSSHEYRIMYLTDAMPNSGVVTPDSLLGMMISAAE